MKNRLLRIMTPLFAMLVIIFTSTATHAATTSQTSAPFLAFGDNQKVSDTISFSTNDMVVIDVTVEVVIDHTSISDLEIDLVHVPTGTTVQLFAHNCDFEDDLDVAFDDNATDPIDSHCAQPTIGTFLPREALASFDGIDPFGEWRLDVADTVGGDAGTFKEWTLNLTVIDPTTTPLNVDVPTDGRLNPNMGDTEVVLYSGSDADGNSTMQVYCINGKASGYLGMVIAESDLPESAPAANTLLRESNICNIELWALANGSQRQYQLNVGPNKDGTVIELLFNDINAVGLTMRTFNLYELQ